MVLQNMPDDAKRPQDAGDSQAAGHVEFDSRGNSVWRWKSDGNESTSILLKRLENDSLQLEPTQTVPTVGTAGASRKHAAKPGREGEPDEDELALEQTRSVKRGGGAGFNPYDHSSS
jgi:hypothetical protein